MIEWNDLVIRDGAGSEILAGTDLGEKIELRIQDEDDLGIYAKLDAGGVMALANWLNHWLQRREVAKGCTDGMRQANP